MLHVSSGAHFAIGCNVRPRNLGQPAESAKTIHCIWCVIIKCTFHENCDQPPLEYTHSMENNVGHCSNYTCTLWISHSRGYTYNSTWFGWRVLPPSTPTHTHTHEFYSLLISLNLVLTICDLKHQDSSLSRLFLSNVNKRSAHNIKGVPGVSAFP